MGASSYAMQDPEHLWRVLGLDFGTRLADLGCGPGEYALEAARRVGPQGHVWALDKDGHTLEALAKVAQARGLNNLTTLTADLRQPLPLDDAVADICLLAMMLHTIKFTLAEGGLFREVRRILRRGGRMAVINFSMADFSFGPPPHLRITPEELDELVLPHGFSRRHLETAKLNYLALYHKK
ncbi:MAG: class I SAM-dependent methyltransferase [Deltaproteobacteria bacterium]|nr:class I SAM-dependent methyltransferase [Deltaproteobacteria bacterium]